MGWQDAPEINDKAPAWASAPILDEEKPKASDNKQRSTLGEIGRQVGLAGRYAVEGAASLPMMVGDAANAGVNMGIRGINKLTDSNIPELMPASQALNQTLTDIGLPNPETATERVVGDASRALAGVAGGNALGKTIEDAASPIAQKLAQVLREKPGMQASSAALGGGAAGATRESGGGEGAQLAAALAASTVIPGASSMAMQTAKGGGRFLGAVVDPFTQGGREQIVGSALRRFSNNTDDVMQNLDAATELVPGSAPTTGTASKDYGLLALEKGLRSQEPARFAQRSSEQNAARNILLDSIAGTDSELAAAKSTRDQVTGNLREQALSGADNVDLSPVNKTIADIRSSGAGKREQVDKAISWVENRLKTATDPKTGLLAPDALYSVRQDINDVLGGKLQGEQANLKLASGQLTKVKGAIDESLEKSAPGFGEYLSKYRDMSKPINQMEAAQDIQKRVMMTAPDIQTGRDFISQPKWSKYVDSNRSDLSRVMNSEQMKKLDAITADLDRGAAINNSAIKAPGSDTMQNITTAHLLGRVLGKQEISNPVAKVMTRPFEWIMKIPEDSAKELLVDAMLDPKLARGLLAKAKPQDVVNFSKALKRRADALGLGTTNALAATDTQKQEAQ